MSNENASPRITREQAREICERAGLTLPLSDEQLNTEIDDVGRQLRVNPRDAADLLIAVRQLVAEFVDDPEQRDRALKICERLEAEAGDDGLRILERCGL